MAPSRSRPRTRAASYPQKPPSNLAASSPSPSANASNNNPFHSSRRDKRSIKHSLLVSKARTSTDKTVSKIRKRRRPGKKLQAAQNLSDLLHSLPKVEDLSSAKPSKTHGQPNSQCELLSKPGMQKRRDRVAKAEQDRFSRNLAQIRGATSQTSRHGEITSQTSQHTSKMPLYSAEDKPPMNSHWSLLRGYISQSIKT